MTHQDDYKLTKDLLEKGGSTVTKIIEQLANSLGMTIEKIFPYYVKQARLESLMSILIWIGFELICVVLLIVMYKIRIHEKNVDASATMAIFLVGMLVVFVIGLVVGVFCLPDWITQASNPEYTAIHSLVRDASRLMRH